MLFGFLYIILATALIAAFGIHMEERMWRERLRRGEKELAELNEKSIEELNEMLTRANN